MKIEVPATELAIACHLIAAAECDRVTVHADERVRVAAHCGSQVFGILIDGTIHEHGYATLLGRDFWTILRPLSSGRRKTSAFTITHDETSDKVLVRNGQTLVFHAQNGGHVQFNDPTSHKHGGMVCVCAWDLAFALRRIGSAATTQPDAHKYGILVDHAGNAEVRLTAGGSRWIASEVIPSERAVKDMRRAIDVRPAMALQKLCEELHEYADVTIHDCKHCVAVSVNGQLRCILPVAPKDYPSYMHLVQNAGKYPIRVTIERNEPIIHYLDRAKNQTVTLTLSDDDKELRCDSKGQDSLTVKVLHCDRMGTAPETRRVTVHADSLLLCMRSSAVPELAIGWADMPDQPLAIWPLGIDGSIHLVARYAITSL